MKLTLPAIVFISVLFYFNPIQSQINTSYKFEKITPKDFSILPPSTDSNAGAIIIADVGSTEFEGNDNGWFTYIYKHTRRVKIINKNAYGIASIGIQLYRDDEDEEKIDRITASTYNLKNGVVEKIDLNKSDIFREKYDKKHTLIKFTLPAVSEGSLIEYSYTIKSTFLFNIPSWTFQDERFPTLWSEYDIAIPGLLSYMTVRQGKSNFFINQSNEKYKNYSIVNKRREGIVQTEERLNVSTAVDVHKWVMKEVPSFKEEDFVYSPNNYINKIEFQLYQYRYGENAQQTQDVVTTWPQAMQKLIDRDDFIKALNENESDLQQMCSNIVNITNDKLKQIKDVYYYVQKNYSVSNTDNIFIKTSLKNVIKNKSGNVGEINLLLTGLMQQLGVPSVPVLLSTRPHGRAVENYPQMENFDYVICRVSYNGTDYYLDASDPLLGFNKLPLDCYNDFAKPVEKDSSFIRLKPELVKEYKNTLAVINNDSAQGYAGHVTEKLGYYESLNARKKIIKSGIESFKEEVKNKAAHENSNIGDIEIDSLTNPESPLSISYRQNFQLHNDEDIIYFNPMLQTPDNPYTEATRMYPVELPCLIDNTYTLNMEVPKGYTIDQIPKPVKLKLNENDGIFMYRFSVDNNTIIFQCRLQINQTFFDAGDYQGLRDFYAYIVKKQNEPIVFKKTKL